MKERLDDKINEIRRYLEELESIKPSSLEEYSTDLREKAACERYFQKIVEAAIDLAILFIRNSGFRGPDNEDSSFAILKEKGIITAESCQKLMNAKGMRNIIAHKYGAVDDEIVFNTVINDIIPDVEEFLDMIETGMK